MYLCIKNSIKKEKSRRIARHDSSPKIYTLPYNGRYKYVLTLKFMKWSVQQRWLWVDNQ